MKITMKDKKLEKELNEIFFGEKDKLSDEEVDTFMKAGEDIISLFKKDLDKATINYAEKINQQAENDVNEKEFFKPFGVVATVGDEVVVTVGNEIVSSIIKGKRLSKLVGTLEARGKVVRNRPTRVFSSFKNENVNFLKNTVFSTGLSEQAILFLQHKNFYKNKN